MSISQNANDSFANKYINFHIFNREIYKDFLKEVNKVLSCKSIMEEKESLINSLWQIFQKEAEKSINYFLTHNDLEPVKYSNIQLSELIDSSFDDSTIDLLKHTVDKSNYEPSNNKKNPENYPNIKLGEINDNSFDDATVDLIKYAEENSNKTIDKSNNQPTSLSRSHLPSLKKDSTKVNLNGTENNSDSANSEDKDIAEFKAEVKSNEKQQINTNTNLLPASVSNESQIKQLSNVHLPEMSKPNNLSSPRNKRNSLKIMMKKADEGDAEAQYNFGVSFSFGKVVQQDKEKSFQYLLKAANQGHMDAQYLTATCYSYAKGVEEDKNEAFKYYLKSAEQGNAKAQFAVGHFYEFGCGNVKKDHNKAIKWYTLAAAQGHAGALKAIHK